VFVSVGYEDGVTFEETTRVQMEKQKAATAAAEQQQQQ
jgi:hypothetical protein